MQIFCRKDDVMTPKLVSNLSSVKNGVVVTAAYDRLYVALISDGIPLRQGMVFKKNLLSSTYKYYSLIYKEIMKSVEASEDEFVLYVDITAHNFIDCVCDANRLLF